MNRSRVALLGGAGTALALDVLTKAWAERALPFQQPLLVLGDLLRFSLGHNRGVAFGLLTGTGLLPTILTGLVIAGLLAWGLHTAGRPAASPKLGLLLGGVLGGALGNFLDRLADGRVTDFLDMGVGTARWPTFNLADVFIVLSLLTLLWGSRSRGAAATEREAKP